MALPSTAPLTSVFCVLCFFDDNIPCLGFFFFSFTHSDRLCLHPGNGVLLLFLKFLNHYAFDTTFFPISLSCLCKTLITCRQWFLTPFVLCLLMPLSYFPFFGGGLFCNVLSNVPQSTLWLTNFLFICCLSQSFCKLAGKIVDITCFFIIFPLHILFLLIFYTYFFFIWTFRGPTAFAFADLFLWVVVSFVSASLLVPLFLGWFFGFCLFLWGCLHELVFWHCIYKNSLRIHLKCIPLKKMSVCFYQAFGGTSSLELF